METATLKVGERTGLNGGIANPLPAFTEVSRGTRGCGSWPGTWTISC